MLNKLLITLWVFVLASLFLYSYVQVDLGLTLSQASLFQTIEKSFQYVGWFNRPLSTYLYCAIVSFLFISYLITLRLAYKKKIGFQMVWGITILASVILIFSYNAFSYDLFNYIFDAKIVTGYHSNPYIHKALDYPNDPMLGFMHWTHRTYPYGPFWLGLTIPLSFLGSGVFIITFYLFKALTVGAYLLSSYMVYRIAQKTKAINPNFALALFALNPLNIIESLVSAHNDIVMIALGLLGVYFLIYEKKIYSWLSLILSIGVKFATALLIPLFAWYPLSKSKNRDFVFLFASAVLMGVAVIMASVRTNFQPWYFLMPLPFISLIAHKKYIVIFTVSFSFLILFQYVPYLYTGNYNSPIPQVMNYMLLLSIGISLLTPFVYRFLKPLLGK